MILKRILLPGLSFLLIGGCQSVSLPTLWKVAHYDSASADVSKLRFAFRYPPRLQPTPDRAFVNVRYGEKDAPAREVRIRLQQSRRADDAAQLAALAGPEPFVVVEVAKDALALVRTEQDAALARRAKGETSGGLVSIRQIYCLAPSAGPEAALHGDVFVHLDDAEGWAPVSRDFEIEIPTDAAERAEFDETIPPCGAAAAAAGPQKPDAAPTTSSKSGSGKPTPRAFDMRIDALPDKRQ